MKDTYMKFYNGKRLQYLETDISGIGLGAGPPAGKRSAHRMKH